MPQMTSHQLKPFCLLLPLLLSACSTPSVVHKPAKELCTGTKRPYKIQGKEYVPQDHYHYEEEGDASWYGPGFHLRSTSCGSTYNMHEYTAAHKTLPIPSVVEVTNVENGRQLQLVINDRGPFVGDRIIDLSKQASLELGTHAKGVGKVRVKTLPEKSAALAAYLKQYGRYGIDPSGRSWDVIYRDEIAGKPFEVQETAELNRLSESDHEPSVVETTYDYEQKHAVNRKAVVQAIPVVSLSGTASKGKDPFDLLLEEVADKENAPIEIIHEEIKPAPRLSPRQLKKALAPKKLNQKSSGHYVQVGHFVNKGNAQNLGSDLSKHGKMQVVQDNKKLYTVKLGPFPSQARAKQVVTRVAKEGHHGARIQN